MISLHRLFISFYIGCHRVMSSDSHPIILSSDTDIEDVVSSSTAVAPPVHSAPQSPLLASTEDTEPFEEGEFAPTPQISPIAPPSVTLAPSDPSVHVATVHPGQTSSPRVRTKIRRTARKRVHSFTITSLASPTTQIPPPPPTVAHLPSHSRDPIPSSDVPPKKRARVYTTGPHTTETQDTPPPARYTIGESSRAATSRGPTAYTLDAQLGDQQGQIDRLRYRVDEILSSRLEDVEEGVEGLVQGRVSIDVSYHGLERRQMQVHESMVQLRGELPELYGRVQRSQEEQGRQAHELALARDRLAIVESREAALQVRVERLEKIVVIMDKEIRRLRGGPGGPSGGS